MCTWSASLLAGVLLVSALVGLPLDSISLVNTENDSSFGKINLDLQKNVEKFYGKTNFVGNQLTIKVYQAFDANNPTLLVLLLPFSGIILIRIENEKIKFYNFQRIASIIFILILVSSSIATPISFSMYYWGNAFANDINESVDHLERELNSISSPSDINNLDNGKIIFSIIKIVNI